MPWRELFQPSVYLCLNGFRLSKSLARVLKNNKETIRKSRSLSELFIDAKTNDVFKYNDLVRLSKLGATLAILGQQGNEAFYNGVLTGFIVTEINENGLDLCVLLMF